MANKPKIFTVTGTPKDINNIFLLRPETAAYRFCAVVNVSDSQCATFDYQKVGFPSFWFPINEIAQWGHSPFLGTLRVFTEYYKGDKPILLHCHAGANRSPSVAYAILLAIGYSPEEAEESISYEDLRNVFQRNIDRKHIPKNIIEFLKVAIENPTFSIHGILQKMDALYDEWSQKKYNEQNDYAIKSDGESDTKLVYNKDTKRFVIVKPWIEPVSKGSFEWNATPTIPKNE